MCIANAIEKLLLRVIIAISRPLQKLIIILLPTLVFLTVQSGFLPRDPTTLDVESFRVALYLISAMYEIAVSTDQPVIEGGVNNDILRDILNGLAADACNWVSTYIHVYNFQFSILGISIIICRAFDNLCRIDIAL